MQTRVKAWVLPIFMLAIIARAPAQDLSSLSGSYGFQVVANQIDSLGSSGGAVIGVFNFDGAGHVSGTAIVKGRNGTPNDAFTGQGGVSGLYTVNPDSTGTMTLQFEFGFSPTLAFTITEGGRALLSSTVLEARDPRRR